LYNEMVGVHHPPFQSSETENAQALVHCVLRCKSMGTSGSTQSDDLTIGEAPHPSRDTQISGSRMPDLPLYAGPKV
jgi:hypothetical protein